MPPRRRRWCSDRCAQAFADNHVWTAARQAALERDGYRCVRCERRTVDLQVHHVTEIDPEAGYATASCAHHLAGLETLCGFHHSEEHGFRREVDRLLVWADGQISRQLVLPGVA